MHNDIIILGGNTSNNIKWLRQMVNVYKKNYNVFSLFFDNWEDNSMIDFEKEEKKLRQLCKGKKNYVIIAKSAGAVLAAIEIEKNNITPSIFVVLGLPLKFTFENRIKIKEILNNINNRCKILIIQQKFDPQGSVKEVFDLLGKNIRIKPINGNKHTYANFLLIKKEVDLFIESSSL